MDVEVTTATSLLNLTDNLDTENSKIVLDMFSELNDRYQQTIIMITHNPEAAANCSRIINMRDGQIVE